MRDSANADPAVPRPVHAGEAAYSLPLLRVWYDVSVFGFNNPVVWKCPTRELIEHYRAHVSGNHLEAGVGSGFLLDRCGFGTATPRLVVADLNESCLTTTARRLVRYRPQALRCNLLEPIAHAGERFDSIGFNYVLHCLPGAIPEKAAAFDHLGELLHPGGVLFGATLLADGVTRGWLARGLMRLFNGLGVFSNSNDTLRDLEAALTARFRDVEIRVAGCAALFSARQVER